MHWKDNFTMLWERIQALKGKTLHTGRRRKVFEVVDVTDDHAFFVPQDGNGTTRSFPRRGFEHIAGLGLNPSIVTRQRVQEEFPRDQNSCYVTAILAEVGIAAKG